MVRSNKSSTATSCGESASNGGNVRHVYEVTGDASAALTMLNSNISSNNKVSNTSTSNPLVVEEYNRCILEAASSTSTTTTTTTASLPSWINDSLQVQEQKLRSAATTSTNSRIRRQREEWILRYNRGLALWTCGKTLASLELVWKTLQPEVVLSNSNSNTKQLSQDLLSIACRMAFLLLEGLLSWNVASTTGIDNEVLEDGFDLEGLLTWLNASIEQVEDPQYKFLWSLYKGRLDFVSRDPRGKLVDSKIRSARKELKQAMEIFQHKLRPATNNDSGSLASSSMASEEPSSTSSLPPQQQHQHQQQFQAPLLSPILQGQNQAALNLKANTEQLKGNVKKSLILLSEAAQASGGDALATSITNNNNSNYESIHYNNLGVVYETHGKPHLALHAWSKALRSLSSSSSGNTTTTTTSTMSSVQSDGTARPDPSLPIMYNAATGALQARNYASAYECYATVLRHSPWRDRPRVWLRLAEACIGLQTQRTRGSKGRFSKVQVDGQDKGILLQTLPDQSSASDEEHPNPSLLASPKDLEQVQTNPIPRARLSLERAIALFEQQQQHNDKDGLTSAHLSMSFVCLEDGDYPMALEHAKWVLTSNENNNNNNNSMTGEEEEEVNAVRKATSQRQLATARMYASEASCAMGDAVQSMLHLVGDGKDDAFDRLASDLAGGVTIETAASNPSAKRRLAKAQTFVRCSASAASAHLGNLPAAKQLAMSAQAMEDAARPLVSRGEGSSARRALVYCLLREGNSGAALTLMRSAR